MARYYKPIRFPKTSVGRLGALRRAETLLRGLEMEHPDGCGCVICEAAHAVWRARITLTRPGWQGPL